MENLIEFAIEISVPACFVALIAAGISVLILRSGGLYKRKSFLFGLPAAFSILIGAAGPDDHTNLYQWAYFVLPGMALSIFTVWYFFRDQPRGAQS